MKGIIGFENLKINCIIGVYPEERVNEQLIYVDLKVQIDLTDCIKTDQVKDTFDYDKLTQICINLAKVNRFNLIETYASQVLKELSKIVPMSWGQIKVKKPNAIPNADHAIVELEWKTS